MGGNRKAHKKIPLETAEIIDKVESMKYRAVAFMKIGNGEVTVFSKNGIPLALFRTSRNDVRQLFKQK